ncbi:hypothetical protein F8538_05580 [Edwardsiella ictaluri]|uniref:EpsG family protein n=1 Tax=Edwardsiella ictaluri TaxID=67780 RepID=UPI0018DBAE25|nr:EpsG family protein [Edwardsiella ictaluri]QPW26367.1 hypothetical protein F8538_05580 [Edwardsiella ictaluri]
MNKKIGYTLLSVLIAFLYLCWSAYFLCGVEVKGDTFQYFLNFKNINHDLFPYGVEFLVPFVMKLVELSGGGFYVFLLISIWLWTPLIYIFSYRMCNNVLYFPIVVFFFSSVFLLNAVFLVRQYYAALFFIFYALSFKNRLKYIFCFFGLFSQLSSLIWFALVYRRLRFVFDNKLMLFSLLVIVIAFNLSGGVVNLSEISKIIMEYNIPDVIKRKLGYYIVNDTSSHISVLSLLLVYLMLFYSFFLLQMNIVSDKGRVISFFVFMSSFLFLLFWFNNVPATRLGFFSYYFYIPCATLLIILHLHYKNPLNL